MKSGTSTKSALWLMIATLITIVLASAVSGENPWDTDKRPKQSFVPGGGSDSILVTTTDSIRTVVISTTASSSRGFSWVETVNRVVFYFARNYAEWSKPSASARSPKSDR